MAQTKIGRGELELQVSAAAFTSDNIAANAESPGDEYFILNPTLLYDIETPRLDSEISLSTPIIRFASETQFDTEDIAFSAKSSLPFLPNSPVYGDVSFSYRDVVEVDQLVNQRFASENTTFGFSGGIKLGQKVDLRGGASYNERLTDVLSDYERTSYYGGVQFNEVLGSANAYIDYRYQLRKTIGSLRNDNIDDGDEGIRVGINGQILPEHLFPKLEADFSVGVAKSDSFTDEDGEDEVLIASGSLRYAATQKTDVDFSISRNLTISTLDQNVERFTTNLSVEHNPRQNLSLAWGVGYAESDFGFSPSAALFQRNDETFKANANVSFIFTTPWFVTAGFEFRDTSSTREISDYSSTTFFISTTRIF